MLVIDKTKISQNLVDMLINDPPLERILAIMEITVVGGIGHKRIDEIGGVMQEYTSKLKEIIEIKGFVN